MEWQTIIVAITPVLIEVIKWAAPKIPGKIIPIVAPALGAMADMAGSYAGLWASNPIAGALLGMAGVGLRELYDQLMKSKIAAGDAQTPPTT